MSATIRRTILSCVAMATAFGGALSAGSGAAQAAEKPEIPAPLQPWVGWVMHTHKDQVCAADGDDRHCEWPGALKIELQPDGASFTLQVWRDRPGRVVIWGNVDAWPQQVQLDEKATLVVTTPLQQPAVTVPAGHHVIRGRLLWEQPPEVLIIPESAGLVSIVRDGQPVSTPRREAERLWLSGGPKQDHESDSLRVEVQRRIADGVPLKIETRVILKVAGRSRDVVLGNLLIPGSVPVQLRSPLPVQLASDGQARAHVRAGSHTITVDAVLSTNPGELKVPKPLSDATSNEMWVFEPAPELRAARVSGLTAIDPQRTSLPADWRSGSAYVAEAGKTLKLETVRRGQPSPAPNRLTLSRELWLDMDGANFTARDTISGVMHRDWRLDFAVRGLLGRVSGDGEDRLITTNPKTGRPGVELRRSKLNVVADIHLPRSTTIPAVGWDFDVRKLSTTLHLPPGWTLLGADGADQAPGTWLGSWTLFDFFLVLMVALGAGKLLGWPWAGVALLAMVICHGQDDAPRWIWLHLLASAALVRALPAGLVRKLAWVYRGGAVLWLLLTLVPFSIQQVRGGIYPQVQPAGLNASFATGAQRMASAPDMAMSAAKEERMAEADDSGGSRRYMKSAQKARRKGGAKKNVLYDRNSALQQVDPNAVVQTGPGLPDWSWSTWHLRWSGPVQRHQRVDLWLLSPTHNLILAFGRVLLLALLALALLEITALRSWLRDYRKEPESEAGSGSTAALIVIAALASALALATPSTAAAKSRALLANPDKKQPIQAANQQVQRLLNAPPQSNTSARNNIDDRPADLELGLPDTPAGEVLRELRTRLLAAAACDGPCTVAANMDLKLRDDRLVLKAEVHAQQLAAWTIPGPLSAIAVRTVEVDGVVTTDLRQTGAGMLQVRLTKGQHTVRVLADLPRRNVIAMQFDEAARPRRVTVVASGWHVDGVGRTGVPDATLQLSRKRAATLAEGATTTDAETELPPWYQVSRTFLLGLPWTVETRIRRQTTDRPALVKLPLLPGEAVLTANARIEESAAGKVALVQFPRDTAEVVLRSELPQSEAITLKAASGTPWTEQWKLTCSPIFRCLPKGLAPIKSIDGGQHTLRWAPWPAEEVAIQVQRPKGATGQAVTVDRVDYHLRPGNRLLEARLTLSTRASQGGFREVTLPKDAALQRVLIDGKEKTITAEKGVVRLPLQPGKRKFELRWQQPWERHLLERAPPVKIGGAAVNVRVTIERGEDRWLLWARGPSWGPAVLFWSHAFVLLLLSLGLGRVPGSPLKTWQWLLLSFGFAQVPVAVLFVVVSWFAAMTWRRSFWRKRTDISYAAGFDLSQLMLAGWTVAALGSLYGAIHSNLLLDVDMQVAGGGSNNHSLVWYVDRVTDVLPQPAMLSLPLLVWRLAMLLWSLWLVYSLLKWLPWAWASYSDGGLWRRTQRSVPPARSGKGPIPPPPGTHADLSGGQQPTAAEAEPPIE